MAILRLQSELKMKIEHIADMEFDLTSKTKRISELQADTAKYRSM
jgi:hypothetical protein